MQSHDIYMKALAFQRYLKMVNDIFSYLIHYSTKPLHKLFNMDKKEFKEFKSRVMSQHATLKDWKMLVAVYTCLQHERLSRVYTDFFEPYGMP